MQWRQRKWFAARTMEYFENLEKTSASIIIKESERSLSPHTSSKLLWCLKILRKLEYFLRTFFCFISLLLLYIEIHPSSKN